MGRFSREDSVWTTIVATLRDEFADLTDTEQFVRVVSRMLFAVLLGAVVGYEREMRNSTAGLRTHMLVALGTASIVISAVQLGYASDAMSRVLQGVSTGIGFIGAGTILKRAAAREIRGLTTAAGLWMTAALAVAAGLGQYFIGLLGAVVTLGVLAGVKRVEDRIGSDAG